MKPITVLQLGSPNGMFGAERWILALARHMPRERIRTLIGVIDDTPRGVDADLVRHAREMGFETLSIRAPGRLSLGAVGALRVAIRREGIDVVNSHFYKTSIVAALATRGTGCAWVATPHGWSTDAGWALQCYEWLERLAFLRADRVVPLSADLEEGLARIPGIRQRMRLVENGVDVSEVTGSDDVAAEVLAMKRRGKRVVGYLGQLIERKCVHTLLHAMVDLRANGVHAFVVGDGPLRGALETLADTLGVRAEVSFMGFRPDRLAFLRGFDVLALPSTLEGVPRCLMEAMAARVPVVASRIPGVIELVEDGATGMLFTPGDSPGLAAATRRLLDDGEGTRRIVEAAEARVHQRFSAERMGRQYAELYDALLTERAGVDKGTER